MIFLPFETLTFLLLRIIIKSQQNDWEWRNYEIYVNYGGVGTKGNTIKHSRNKTHPVLLQLDFEISSNYLEIPRDKELTPPTRRAQYIYIVCNGQDKQKKNQHQSWYKN